VKADARSRLYVAPHGIAGFVRLIARGTASRGASTRDACATPATRQ
jgi:hypothetical protein